MLIIGEAINTSRLAQGERYVERAVLARDADTLAALAVAQQACGADYLDVNAGTLTDNEPEALAWLTTTVQAATLLPLCVDSPNPAALRAALAVHDRQYGPPLINSITAETARFTAVLPIVLDYQAKVIALAMDDSGIQHDPARRLDVAKGLVERLTIAGLALEDIYLDPLTFPIATGTDVVLGMLDLITNLRAAFPDVHIVAGVSNVSHGLPARAVLNQALLVLAMGRGLDAALIDPRDPHLMDLIAATSALLGQDEYCMDYLARMR